MLPFKPPVLCPALESDHSSSVPVLPISSTICTYRQRYTVGFTQTRFKYFFSPPPTLIININWGNCSSRLPDDNATLRIKKSCVVGKIDLWTFFFLDTLTPLVVKNQTDMIMWLTASAAPHLATWNGLAPRATQLLNWTRGRRNEWVRDSTQDC